MSDYKIYVQNNFNYIKIYILSIRTEKSIYRNVNSFIRVLAS